MINKMDKVIRSIEKRVLALSENATPNELLSLSECILNIHLAVDTGSSDYFDAVEKEFTGIIDETHVNSPVADE